jgi:Ca2+-binding EF-hand superfamily protein
MSVGGIVGGYNPYAAKQFQQNLFDQIDTNGDGSVSKSELEQAVAKAGGTTQAADALYSVLDPGNSGGFSEQQFAQALPGPTLSNQVQAQMIDYQAQGWPGASASQPGGQLGQSLFAHIDSNGDGSISQTELEQAVTGAGGTKAAADALYVKLDPNNTGSVRRAAIHPEPVPGDAAPPSPWRRSRRRQRDRWRQRRGRPHLAVQCRRRWAWKFADPDRAKHLLADRQQRRRHHHAERARTGRYRRRRRHGPAPMRCLRSSTPMAPAA